jgi:hypothetical protein
VEETTSFKGTCKSMRVPEHRKHRFRGIQHPAIVNDVTADADKVVFVPLANRHAAVLFGEHVIDLDLSGYYDQFKMAPGVRQYFVFERNGKYYQMIVMPMGQKQSVSVAQSASKQLVNFETTVYVEVYVDNVRFIHDDPELLVHAAAMFLTRCATCDVTVNEVDVSVLKNLSPAAALEQASALLRPLVKTKGPWLGELFDYKLKTVEMDDKTREKVSRCLEQRNPTFRNLAAVAGILQYASRTYDLKLAPYFAARRAISCIGRLLQDHDELWDVVAPKLCDSVVASFAKWRTDLLRAVPRVIRALEQPQLTLITDASDVFGFGCISIDEFGREAFFAQRWSTADVATSFTKSSARSETEAIFRCACRFVRPAVHRTVLIVTDSSTAVGALAKGHSSSFFVNSVCARLQATFPGIRFVLRHVPGTLNPADAISRGAPKPTHEEWDTARRLADDHRAASAQELHEVVGVNVQAT